MSKRRTKSRLKQRQFKIEDDCYWCGRNVYSNVLGKRGLILLTKHIDHKLPFTYCQQDKVENLVVSCSLCNLFKSGKVFDNEDDIRYYLSKKWREKTHEVFDVRQRFYP